MTTPTSALTTTVAGLGVAHDVAVTGPLTPATLAHRAQLELAPIGRFHNGHELRQARYHTACGSQAAHCVSWGWAYQHGAILCPVCFPAAGGR